MNIMHPVLRRIDLNLLPVFDAVYRSRSVRPAAEELAMSTSALSHALSRLRSALNDPLFYREGHRMCPSVYASQLAPSIASALKFSTRADAAGGVCAGRQHRLHADCDHRFHRVLRLSDADASPAA